MPLANLKTAKVEKDVENAYREALHKERPKAVITSPHGTDGYVTWPPNVRLLLEAKYDLDFKSRLPICNTLGQCLLYLKRFEASGDPIPNVILVGDRNECFVLSTTSVKGFLDLPLDWSVAPSTGQPALTQALVNGLNILPYVYDVDGNFKFREVLDQIEVLAQGEQHQVRATLGNIEALFLQWRDRVFISSGSKPGVKTTPVEQVDLFLKCLFRPTDVYLHPKHKGRLIAPGYPDGVQVNTDQYHSFFDQFVQDYKPSEIEAFYAAKDRLVEDTARRMQGAFFTPRIWVDEAHKMLDAALGPNWRAECLVWDPACGTGNLTRDYPDFGDLILSTAEAPDVEVIRTQGYNAPNASLFQYDFLNDDASPFIEGQNVIPSTVDDQLRQAAKAGKRIVFLMNPPYGTANVLSTEVGANKAGIAWTSVNQQMKDANIGPASQQLYAQFMYRTATLALETYGFKHVTIATYSIPTFMCSGSYKGFRDWWYKQFQYRAGMLFQASHFADVSGRWGISFTIWSSEGGVQDSKSPIPMAVKDVSNYAVIKTGVKSFYNSDAHEASAWVREPTKGLKGSAGLSFTSGLKIRDTEGIGKAFVGNIGYFHSNANCVQHNQQLVNLFSAPFSSGQGSSILPGESFRRCCALFAARKLIAEDWTNQKDEYLRPATEASIAYKQWNDDAIIYALLHPSNNCTAMRNVPYKNKTWTISNHFFWRTHASTLAALDTPATPNLYRDCKAHPSKDVFGCSIGAPVPSSPDPYLGQVLGQTLALSPEALTVLTTLDNLWLQSLPVREDFAMANPDLHLLAWDAGIYQLKNLWRAEFPTEWLALQAQFKALATKLRPGVYDHGFLLLRT